LIGLFSIHALNKPLAFSSRKFVVIVERLVIPTSEPETGESNAWKFWIPDQARHDENS
jgi:hypothetical protein